MITYDARNNTVRTTMGIINMRNLRSGVVCSVRGNDKLGVRWVIGGNRTSAQLGVTPSGTSELNPDNDKSAINLKEKVSAKQTWDCLGYG